MKEEKAKEKLLELEERKVKVAEENARLGWRKLEVLAGRAITGRGARKALNGEVVSEAVSVDSEGALLLRMREVLMDEKRSAEERVAAALGCLGVEERKVLMEGNEGESGK